MPIHPSSRFSLDAIQDYFAHLNPIAQRIARDIQETKCVYGQLWYTLNASEQNDILDETLIKPEISLRYFDSFSSLSSPASSNSSLGCLSKDTSRTASSVDSLAAVVLKNINNSNSAHQQQRDKPQKNDKRITKAKVTDVKNYHAYDGRNLKTFALQRVALKMVQDDTMGAYRDEHSVPFSFRTKSQINLHIIHKVDEAIAQPEDEMSLLSYNKNVERTPQPKTMTKENEVKAILNYQKLQTELKMNLNQLKTKETKSATTTYERFGNVSEPTKEHPPTATNSSSSTTIEIANTSSKKSSVVNKKAEIPNGNGNGKKQTIFKPFIDSTPKPTPSINYAVYTDAYFDQGESSNLMRNCSSSGGLTASSSSAATSDDDRDEDDYDDEKTLCEDVKLLDRRGFDFLNNW